MDTKKQVLGIITTWYPPVNGFFVESYARALAEFYEVHVFVASFGLFSKSKRTEEHGVTVHRIRFPFLPRRNRMLLQRWVRNFGQAVMDTGVGLDMLHAHNFYGAYAAHFIGVHIQLPYYVTLHATQHLDFPLSGFKAMQLKEALAAAKKVICVGDSLAEAIQTQYGIQPLVVPNFVDTELFLPKEKPFKPFKFAMVGFLDERKGIALVLKAIKQLGGMAELHIIGKLESREVSEQQVRLLPNVKYYGQVEHRHIPELLNACHALISFSKTETFGITVIEAMSCGLPVIYTQSGGPEHFVPGFAGYQVSRTVASLSEAMEQLMNSYDQFDQQSIRAYVQSRFDKEVVIQRLINIFNNSED